MSSHSLGMLMEQAPSCLLSSVSVAEIILENYKTCEQLQAIILAFILIVNFYDKMILVPVHQCFCSQGSNIRILPSGSFSLGERIMILALVKGLKKQLWVSNVPFVVSLACTDTNVRDMLECL